MSGVPMEPVHGPPLHLWRWGCGECGCIVLVDREPVDEVETCPCCDVAHPDDEVPWEHADYAEIIGHRFRSELERLAGEAVAERLRADEKHGQQLQRETGITEGWASYGEVLEAVARVQTDGPGDTHWSDIYMEEVGEALTTDNPKDLRAELVQVTATGLGWLRALDQGAGGPA